MMITPTEIKEEGGREEGGRLWRLLTLPSSSITARLYYLLSLSVILLYLVCLAVSTLPELDEDSSSLLLLDMIMFSCVGFSALELIARYYCTLASMADVFNTLLTKICCGSREDEIFPMPSHHCGPRPYRLHLPPTTGVLHGLSFSPSRQRVETVLGVEAVPLLPRPAGPGQAGLGSQAGLPSPPPGLGRPHLPLLRPGVLCRERSARHNLPVTV